MFFFICSPVLFSVRKRQNLPIRKMPGIRSQLLFYFHIFLDIFHLILHNKDMVYEILREFM